jgi:hypothetical protein
MVLLLSAARIIVANRIKCDFALTLSFFVIPAKAGITNKFFQPSDSVAG